MDDELNAAARENMVKDAPVKKRKKRVAKQIKKEVKDEKITLPRLSENDGGDINLS
jgi:hypothetical protein